MGVEEVTTTFRERKTQNRPSSSKRRRPLKTPPFTKEKKRGVKSLLSQKDLKEGPTQSVRILQARTVVGHQYTMEVVGRPFEKKNEKKENNSF